MAKRIKLKKNNNMKLNQEIFYKYGGDTTNLINFEVFEKINENKNFKKKISAKTKKQQELIDVLGDDKKPIVVVTGPAGTGKTMISTSFAIEAFESGKYEKIVICRPNVAVDDRDIGYLPGDILEKMAPWTRPFEDIFLEYYKKTEYTKMLEEGLIEIVPLAYIRGRTFKNAFVIIDEAQGTTPNSILSILTRIGENSKYVITGDLKQSDFLHKNGLNDFVERIKNRELKFIKLVEFSKEDIQRHPAISEVLDLYDNISFYTEIEYEQKVSETKKNKSRKINNKDNTEGINGFSIDNLPNFLR